jgi:glyoxylase-like metal-dependent hydrolase (beta-lactamase superfamily II)
MSEKEAKYVENGFTPLPRGTFPITRIISNLGTWIGQKKFGYKPFVSEVLVTDELELKEFNISIISTGGHSKGSMSIIVDNEIAIVGDAMFGVFKKSVFPPFADNVNEMINSWGRLLKTACHTFLPGHGKQIKRELFQREYDIYLQKNLHKK